MSAGEGKAQESSGCGSGGGGGGSRRLGGVKKALTKESACCRLTRRQDPVTRDLVGLCLLVSELFDWPRSVCAPSPALVCPL